MLENKGCSNELNPNIDFSCDAEWEEFGKEAKGKILVIGISGIMASQLETAAEAMNKITEAFEDINSIFPFNAMKDSIDKMKLIKEFREKPQKRNFVNKFNKNQHRKK